MPEHLEPENLKRLKLHDIYRILKWVFNYEKRPKFFPVKNNNKPFTVNFVVIKDYKDHEFVLPTLYKCKIGDKLNIDSLCYNLTREVNIRKLEPRLDVITEQNLEYVFYIRIEQMYDNKLFINTDTSLVCPDKKNVFIKTTKHFLVSMDLEMVTTRGGREAGRISILDYQGNVVYDKYVKPVCEVMDYETKYSGLTQELLAEGVEFSQALDDISGIIGTNTVILGHALENDLSVLKMYHDKIIDTSYLFLSVESRRVSLQQLCRVYMNYNIHEGSHCSVEDARMCLLLLSLKIQEMLIANDVTSNQIKLRDNVKFFSNLRELTEQQQYGLMLCTTDSKTLKHNVDQLIKLRALTFYFYEDKGKIITEF